METQWEIEKYIFKQNTNVKIRQASKREAGEKLYDVANGKVSNYDKMGKFINLLFYFCFAVSLIEVCYCQESQFRLCGDPKCQTIISKATAQTNYNADSSEKISFRARDSVDVYSKPVDPKGQLWEVEIEGKKGLAPKIHLREDKAVIKKVNLVKVPIVSKNDGTTPKVELPHLSSSIPPDNTETSTTAPLPSDPAKVETGSGSTDTSTEKPNASPIQENKEIDGTQVPSGYYDDDDEGGVEIEEEDIESDTDKASPSQKKDETQKQGPAAPDDNSIQKQNESQIETEMVQGTGINEIAKEGNNTPSNTRNDPSNGENNSIQADSLDNSSSNGIEAKGDIAQKNEKEGAKSEETKQQPSAVQSELIKENTVEDSADKVDDIEQDKSRIGQPKEESSKDTDEKKVDELSSEEKSKDIKDQNSEDSGGLGAQIGSVWSQLLTSAKNNFKQNEVPAVETLQPSEKEATQNKLETTTSPEQNITESLGDAQNASQIEVGDTNQLNYTRSLDLNVPEVTSNETKETLPTDEYDPEPSKATEGDHEANKNLETDENQSISKDTQLTGNVNTQTKDIKGDLRTQHGDQNTTGSGTTEVKEDNLLPKQQEIEKTTESKTTEAMDSGSSLPNLQLDQPSIDTAPKDSSGVPLIQQKELKNDGKTHQHQNAINKDEPSSQKLNNEAKGSDRIKTEQDESSKLIESQDAVNMNSKELDQTDEKESVTVEETNDRERNEGKHEPVPNSSLDETSLNTAAEENSASEVERGDENVSKESEYTTSSNEDIKNISNGSDERANDLEESQENLNAEKEPIIGEGEIEEIFHYPEVSTPSPEVKNTPDPSEDKITVEKVKNNWFFSNVFGAVSNFWSTISKDEQHKEEENFDDDLSKILFPDRPEESAQQSSLPDGGYCEQITPNSCPTSDKSSRHLAMLPSESEMCSAERDFFSSLSDKVLEMVDLLACLLITALTTLVFSFGYYCICRGRKEGALLSKLNIVERSLLASNKETAILKHELIETKNKLMSIEDNSFGSNDMVIALKKELQDSEDMKFRLEEQVASLEKELENAAEAGLELNKIVSELLNNQSGDDSIISTVEELQKQLNEQQNTIFQINATLAEKSRENSELQLILTNQAAKFQEEIQSLKQKSEDLENYKILLESKLEESKLLLQDELAKAANEKHLEIQNIGKEMSAFKVKYDDVYRKLQASEARAQVLEECLNGVKNNAKFNIKDLIDAVNLKTEVMAIKRERDSLKERLEGEMDARKLLEDHVKIISEEVSNLKREYNHSEKEKVEAQTRLEVLSSYFKEKETQLQKELSLKEAMWLKQQGETSSTVERVRLMQDEIQTLKSQNDSLRAEIEAQAATHKTHIANLESRAHESWLAARQSERKLEEARTEATALRRKLTTMAGNPIQIETNTQTRSQSAVVDGHPNDVNNAPSPVLMDSASSPLLGGLPPLPSFLPPPPYRAPPHPFMSMPPPFMPPGEMRPPPLGRLMSPPPPPLPDRYSPSLVDERDRYSPPNGRYSPDDRYNYPTDVMSNYDTETDFSPPPSPGVRSGGGGGGGGNGGGGGYNSREGERDRGRERNSRGYKPFSPPPPSNSDRNKKSKGILSSGSADSYDSRQSKGKGKVMIARDPH